MAKHVLLRWLSSRVEDIGNHRLVSFSESRGTRTGCLAAIRALLNSHYVSADVFSKRLAALGAAKTSQLLREHLPQTKAARSGDLGEILATETAEQHLGFIVPVRRLRWKDGRNMALRGDDIIGIDNSGKKLRLLKGESKSRVALSSTVIDAAAKALDGNKGRPGRHSVLFVAARLYERGEDDLATALEQATLNSFRQADVEHMLFTLSANDSSSLLRQHLSKHRAPRKRHCLAVHVSDHGAFVKSVYEGL